MNRTMKTTARITTPETAQDPWRYGERHLRRVGPDGQVSYETVPLKKEDLLFPEEGDHLVLTDDHTTDYVYLRGVLRRNAAKHRGRRVFGDHRIDFEAPGIAPLGPDLIVLDDVGDWDGSRGTFPVVSMGAVARLALEITSPDTRPNDVNLKPDLYYRCGVECYAIVDRQGEDGQTVRVLAYKAGPRRYVDIPPDKRGRVWLESVGLWLGIADGYAVCYDRRGRRIPPLEEQADAEAQARRAAEQRASDLQKQVEALQAQLRRARGGR